MRQDWREYSGFGELLCLILAWSVGLGAVWVDYAAQTKKNGGDKVAVSGARQPTGEYFD